MQCRDNCGACCIAPSIARPFHGMPEGKPAGVPCVHLAPDRRCRLFGDPRRPAFCGAFEPEPAFCGSGSEEAEVLLAALEIQSAPAAGVR